MKKILGLDIGTTSIGWAIVEANDEKKVNEKNNHTAVTDINNDRIGIYKDAVGVRIIPSSDEMYQRFQKGQKLNDSKGNTLTPTAKRRVKRGARRMKNRYKLRRDKLCTVLDLLEMLPDASFEKVINTNGKTTWKPIENTNSSWYTKKKEYEFDEKGKKRKKRSEGDIGEQLYKLRAEAVNKSKNISLKDWGRILLHLNQWRGYSSDRFLKVDKPVKEYYTVQIAEFDINNFEPIYDKKDKEKKVPLYNKYQIGLTSEDGIEIQENEEKKIVYKISGIVFYKNPDIKQGDFITIKNISSGKSEKKISTDYGNFTITNPDTDDWDFNRQKLNKSLKEWCEADGTVGSYFYKQHYIDKEIDRIRNNVVNRDWYEDEFEKIWVVQYPRFKSQFEKLNIDYILQSTFKDVSVINEVKAKSTFEEQLKFLIKEKIIYYQRPWQQSKNKAGCRFEKVRVYKRYFDKDTQTYKLKDKPEYEGRKVIPRSHPLHQDFKLWQQINNVRLFYNEPNKVLADGKVVDGKTDLFASPELFQQHTGKSIQEIKEMLYQALQNEKSLSWRVFVKDTLNNIHVADELETQGRIIKGKRISKREGLDADTGEVVKTFYSVNFRKQKRDKSGFEDIRLKGNTTKRALKDALSEWFKEKGYLKINEVGDVESNTTNNWFNSIAKQSKDNHQPEQKNRKGEEVKSFNYQAKNYEVTNLQLLWEIIYDITHRNEDGVINAIKKNFKDESGKCIFSEETLKVLAKVKFDDNGMGNLSAKAIRNLLPLMSNGSNMTEKLTKKVQSLIDLNNSEKEQKKEDDEKLECIKDFVSDKNSRKKLSQFKTLENFRYLNYWEAAAVVYGSHSANKIHRVEKLERIPKGKLNNPVVEKIVNETLMLVNDITSRYGKLDEIRIELARELKNSADERQQIDEAIRNNEARNELAKKMLRELFQITSPSLNDLTKFKIYEDAAKKVDEKYYNEELKGKKQVNKDAIMYENKNGKKEFFDYAKAYKEFGLKEPRKADIERYKLWMDQLCQCPYTGEVIKLADVFTAKYEVEHIIPRQRYYDDSYSNKVITRKVVNDLKGSKTAFEFITQESEKSITDTTDNKTLSVLKWDGENNTDPYPSHITRLFPKGRKQKNLMRKDIPDDPIERQLKETQYINKKLKEELSKILPEGKEVQVTTGAITDILRDSWHLNDVMKELVRKRYENFIIGMGSGTASKGATYTKINYKITVLNKRTNKEEPIEIFPGFSKRLDHRHHVLDAIIVACTKQWHIQYVNRLNASWSVEDVTDEKQKANKYEWNKEDILRKNKKGETGTYDFQYPWKGYNSQQIVDVLKRVIVSHKNTIPLISPSKNILRKNGEMKIIGKPEDSVSIRASLHKETLIGFRKFYNNERKVPIEEIVRNIFETRHKARTDLKPVLSFNELINRIVFKENFRNELKKIFDTYANSGLDDTQIQKKVEDDIKNKKPFEWAYTFIVTATKTGTDKSGTIDKLPPDKITDEKISRYLTYRLNFIKSIEDNIKRLKKEKADDILIENQTELLKKAKDFPDGYPIYYNAIYDVRIPSDTRKWIPVIKLNQELFDKIEYHKNKKIDNQRTNEVKDKLLDYKGNLSWEDAFNPERVFIDEPIIVGKNKIKIKKASIKNKTTLETLYPIRPETKTYVELDGNYRVYMFEKTDDDNNKRHWRLLSNMDAALLKIENRKAKTELLYPQELVKDLTEQGFKQIFSFGKNDTVFIPPAKRITIKGKKKDKEIIVSSMSADEINELFDWNITESNTIEDVKEKQKKISENLWQVSIISKSATDPNGSIHYVSMHTADIIEIPINEINSAIMQDIVREKIEEMKKVYNSTESSTEKNNNKSIKEKIIVGNDYLWQNCIKIYVDKLGKKVIPYWEFPNGCWSKEIAEKLGLIEKSL